MSLNRDYKSVRLRGRLFPAVIQRLEAQAGAVHMRVLWALVGRHLRKSMGELHIVSQGVFAVANACPCAMS